MDLVLLINLNVQLLNAHHIYHINVKTDSVFLILNSVIRTMVAHIINHSNALKVFASTNSAHAHNNKVILHVQLMKIIFVLMDHVLEILSNAH